MSPVLPLPLPSPVTDVTNQPLHPFPQIQTASESFSTQYLKSPHTGPSEPAPHLKAMPILGPVPSPDFREKPSREKAAGHHDRGHGLGGRLTPNQFLHILLNPGQVAELRFCLNKLKILTRVL